MNLRHPYLLLVNSFFCFLVFAFPLHSQTNMNAKKDSNRFNQKNSNQDQIRNETGEESEVSIEVTHEIVSDFVWRGQSFSGDYIARRDNLPYKNFREAYTYVPVVRMSHSNGFFFELESNIALKGRSDRDSDQRIQSYPGGNAIDVNRLVLPTMVTQNDKTIFFDSSNAVYSDKCNPSLPDHPLINPCAIDPSKIKPYAEKNGLARSDGLFTTFAYEMETSKYGTFTVGSWWYFKQDRSSKNTWNEYFIWWELPWMKRILNPTVQSFKQTSANTEAGYASQYSSFSVRYVLFEKKEISIEWNSNIGYVWVNNPESKKSGINDITTSLKLNWNQCFLSLNHAHRPEIDLYDNEKVYFLNSESKSSTQNLSERDGLVSDPSKLYGISNEIISQSIDQLETAEIVKLWANQRYTNQSIPRNLFWIGFGINQSFE